jgi:hypothetical protein
MNEYGIKKLGRWSSGSLMTYIHAQISSFFQQDLAMHMSTQQPFHNLAASEQSNNNLVFSNQAQWHPT